MSAGDTGSGILAGAGPYGILLSLGFSLAKGLVAHFVKAKLPQDIIDAAQAVVDKLEAHAKDVMSADQWEALRG